MPSRRLWWRCATCRRWSASAIFSGWMIEMSVEKQQVSAESRLQWLDEELRQTKAALHKVEHELEQALSQIWSLDSGLRKLEETIGAAGGVADALPGVQEGIRQL